MTTMVALVGEQALPNFLPVLHDKPDDVVFVYTEKTQSKYENLKVVLESLKFNVSGVETDPFDIAAIVMALNKGLAKIIASEPQLLVFNLTGGTKTMSLAAYQVAAQCNAPVIYLQSDRGQSVVYRYIWHNQQLSCEQKEVLPEYLHLRDMLDLHLGRGKDAIGKKTWEEKGPRPQKNHSHLFELAIVQALRSYGYEVMCGVKGKGNQVDIDVMIRYKNQIGIIEAKTSEKGGVTDLDGAKQLSNAMRYLGGTYIQQFLVINGSASKDLQMMCGLLRIPIISLSNYKRGPDSFIISQEDSKTLLSIIDQAMKAVTVRS